MKILSVKPATCYYVVTDIPWTKARAFKRIKDVRLYEVSPTNPPGMGTTIGLLVAGRDKELAKFIVEDLIASYGIKL